MEVLAWLRWNDLEGGLRQTTLLKLSRHPTDWLISVIIYFFLGWITPLTWHRTGRIKMTFLGKYKYLPCSIPFYGSIFNWGDALKFFFWATLPLCFKYLSTSSGSPQFKGWTLEIENCALHFGILTSKATRATRVRARPLPVSLSGLQRPHEIGPKKGMESKRW